MIFYCVSNMNFKNIVRLWRIYFYLLYLKYTYMKENVKIGRMIRIMLKMLL